MMTTTQFRDEFRAPNGFRMSIELCQGVWHTFAREGNDNDPTVRAHGSREEAREYARSIFEH